nr:deoxyribodipyrimidine photo-lyase [Acidisoma cellulosilyticum]
MTKSKTKQAPVLLWFRRDLRLADQDAVAAAAESGAPVVPVFILDDSDRRPHRAIGGASRWWLHYSLQNLGESLERLENPLILRRGDSAKTILALVAETGASAVHTGFMPDPGDRTIDKTVHDALTDKDCQLIRHRTTLLHDPHKVKTQTGNPFRVFTPFSKAFEAQVHVRPPTPAPKHLSAGPTLASDKLADWHLLPTIPWDKGMAEEWTPGEAGAAERLADFVADAVSDYQTARDIPGEAGTSRLSPHLHWGEISPWQVWEAVGQAKGHAGVTTYRRELIWREFAAHLLWHYPQLVDQPLRTEFSDFPWRDDRAGETAWQRGQTGIPIVDAGLRELWSIGWMHNRVRMIVASLLVKHLLIPWQTGESWFWDTLVDADLANNCVSWQWVAGCGADAAPFFRIFNPVLQGKKFDPKGYYVRQWLPELKDLPDAHIHEPWAAPEIILRAAKVSLGKTYPMPIVDLAEGRARALAALKQISGRNG